MSVQFAEEKDVYSERPHLAVIVGGVVPEDAPMPDEPIVGKSQQTWYKKLTDEETAAKISEMDPEQQTRIAAGVVQVLRNLPELRPSTPEQKEKRIEMIASFLGGMSCPEIARIDGKSSSAVYTSVNGVGEKIVKQVPEEARLQIVETPGEVTFTPLKQVAAKRKPRQAKQADPLEREIVSSPDQEMNSEIIHRILDHDLLLPSQEIDLAKRIEKGDLQAKDKIILHNMRLVLSQAKRYQHITTDFSLTDLMQEGTLGLIRAAEKFDWRKGYRFSTYATLWIRQAIQRGIADKGRHIRLPVHVNEKQRKLSKVAEEMGLQLEGSMESLKKLSESTEIPLEDIMLIQRATFKPVYLDKPVGDDEGDTFGSLQDSGFDIIEEVSESVEYDLLYQKLGELRDIDAGFAEIVELHFGIGTDKPMNISQISKRTGKTSEKVRKELALAIEFLHHRMKDPEPVMV